MLQQDASLSVAQITLIMMEILKGTSYLHERGKVHGGLKPENVIFSLNGDLKLSDTGIGSVSTKYFSSELFTEGPYVSPELSQGGLLSPAADVYAIAAIFKELIHTKLPESKNTGKAQEIDSELLEELEDVFASALSAKASERPTASALLKLQAK